MSAAEGKSAASRDAAAIEHPEAAAGPLDGANPLRPDPLRPLSKKSVGRSGGGMNCPPPASLSPGVVGRSGTHREAAGRTGSWTEAQRLCLRHLDWLGPLDVRALATATAMHPGEVLAALRGLRALGHVARVADAWRITDLAINTAEATNAS